jgi:ABC-2 type transport system permease protein
MNTLWTLARKDLLLLWRDRVSLFWMLGMPLVFALFFGSVFGGGGPGKSNPLRVAVIAENLSDAGRRLAQKLDASDAIEVEEMPRALATEAVRKGTKLAFLDIKQAPSDELGMFAGQMPVIELGIDPSRQAEKGLLKGLLNEAVFAGFRDLMTDPAKTRAQIQRMNEQVKKDPDVGVVQKLALTTFFNAFDNFLGTPKVAGPESGAAAMEPQITEVAITRQREGPPNAYSISFPQSILWGILGCAAGFAITMVRERTNGTLVRLLTAPLSHATILAGKALACMISCCVVTAVLTTVGVMFFGVRIGSVPLLVLGTACAGACFAGLTMLLGSLGKTEQAVSGVAWGTLLMMAMLGGGMVPQIAMPAWMLQAGAVSPARWAIQVLEGAIWRDFSIGEMLLPCGVLLAMGAAAFAIGAVRLHRAK